MEFSGEVSSNNNEKQLELLAIIRVLIQSCTLLELEKFVAIANWERFY